jgi:hypothetical protein
LIGVANVENFELLIFSSCSEILATSWCCDGCNWGRRVSKHRYHWLWSHVWSPHSYFSRSVSNAHNCILYILGHSEGLSSLRLDFCYCFSETNVKIL